MKEIKHPVRQSAAFISACFLLAASTAASAGSTVSLSGFLQAGSPSSFSIADLQSSSTTYTVNGDTYTGVSLYNYVHTYVATDPTVPKNDILRDYVTATGSNGSSFTYALGSLNGSGFGVQNDFIAYSDTNGTLNGISIIADDGANVANLTSLNVGHVSYAGAGPGGSSSSFTINGDVINPATYTASNLPNGLTPQTVTVSSTGGTLPGSSFTGVSLWNLLVLAGLSTDPATLANEYVIATGTDNYQAVISLEELNPLYGNNNDLLAYANGSGGTLGSSGFARVVLPADGKGGRYVSNLTSLTVVSAVPLPPSAVLMLSGLLAVGGSLRKRLSTVLPA